jgi:molecular chaperone GrpE (heat shock protein)
VHQVVTEDPAVHNTIVSVERPGYADGARIIRQPEVVVARIGGGS